jgi:hypothetical protein
LDICRHRYELLGDKEKSELSKLVELKITLRVTLTSIETSRDNVPVEHGDSPSGDSHHEPDEKSRDNIPVKHDDGPPSGSHREVNKISGDDVLVERDDSHRPDEKPKDNVPVEHDNSPPGNSHHTADESKRDKMVIDDKLRSNIANWKKNLKSYLGESNTAIQPFSNLPAMFEKLRITEWDIRISIIKRRFDLESFYLAAVESKFHTGERWNRGGRVSLITEIGKGVLEGITVSAKTVDHYVKLGLGFHL